MSRAIRLLLYFVVGLLLGTTVVLAHADVIAATPISNGPAEKWFSAPGYSGRDANAACASTATATYGTRYYGVTAGVINAPRTQTCDGTDSWGPTYKTAFTSFPHQWKCPDGQTPSSIQSQDTQPTNCVGGYTCPSGYTGPQTINGQPNMCQGQTCEAGKVWDAELGGCAEVCDGYQTRPPGSLTCVCDAGLLNNQAGERPWFNGTESAIPDALCSGGCQRRLGFGLNSGSGWAAEGGAFTGEKCVDGQPSVEEKPAIPKKKPPCAPSEGVMTSTSGTVACVPEGVPGAKAPKVEKKTKTETFPDDSQKKTEETKTTDTQTGATSTSTTVTVTAGGGGGTMAGTPGSSSGTADETEECEGDDCGECDPKLEMCGDPAFDGLYEKKDKTVGDVLNGFSSGMQSTPIGEAFTGVFDIQTPAGSCPNLSANIPYLNTSIDLAPYICSATAIQYLEAMGTILKVVVGYIAITWILF